MRLLANAHFVEDLLETDSSASMSVFRDHIGLLVDVEVCLRRDRTALRSAPAIGLPRTSSFFSKI